MAKKDENSLAKKPNVEGRMLPNNFEAEQAVLGCALIDSEATLTVVSRLEDIDFYNQTHKQIFKVIREIFKKASPVDIVTVTDELEKQGLIESVGGMNYITLLSNTVPSSASCGYYIDIVKRDSVLRQVILTSGKIIEQAYDKGSDETILGAAEKAFYEIAEKGQTGALEKIDVSLEKVMNKFEEIHKDNTLLRGLKTGFYQIDKATNGLQKTDLIILAARPGVGKTSLAMNIVSNAALDYKAKCAVFSLEMGREQLTQRMLCSVSNVSMAKALRGELSEGDWAKFWRAEKKLKEADIYIDDNAMNTPSQVLSKCRKLKREKGLDLVVIDYLGLMKSDEKTDSRQNEVASISRQLKILAKEVEVPVLVLCQLNRDVEKRDDGKPGRPVLSDLRDSGSIEQDADMVWFIHRDMTKVEDANNPNSNYTAELIIAKFRNGQPGSVFLGWDGSRTSFVNLEKDANEQSIVDIYQKNDDLKKAKKAENAKDLDEVHKQVEDVINEVDAFVPDGLMPPPAEDFAPPELPAGKDFSKVIIESTDDLF